MRVHVQDNGDSEFSEPGRVIEPLVWTPQPDYSCCMRIARVHPNPSYSALLDGVSARILPDDPELADWCSNYLKRHRMRFLEDLAIADNLTPVGTRIVEVGAVPPAMNATLRQTGRDIVGLDIDPSRFSACIADLSLDIRTCNVETELWPVQDGWADAVMMNEVFEHLRIDPIATLAESTRVLRQGGLLLLSTPNLASFRGYINLLREKHAWAIGANPFSEYSKLRTIGHMGHVREYTHREVVEFVGNCGLTPILLLFRGGPSGWKERVATAIRPSLLPYCSLVAVRSASG